MKAFFYFVTAAIALLFYVSLVSFSGLGSVNPLAWLLVALLFIAAFLLTKYKWWGAVFGLSVGIVLLWMSSQYTGQTIDIERPVGIILCLFYMICGTVLFVRKK